MDRPDRSSETAWWAGNLFLHAAAVVTSAGALLVLGHSGAGKSTLCGLVAEQLPTLADDVVRLELRGETEGAWYVFDGRPASAAQLRAVPLAGALRVFQAEATSLTRATPLQTCGYLLDAVFEVVAQRHVENGLKRAWFACAAEVARRHPGWKLRFTKGPETARLLCEQSWA